MSMWENDDRAPQAEAKPDTERQSAAEAADTLGVRRASANRRTAAGKIKGKLEDFFNGVAIAIATTGDMHCATIMAQRAEPLAEAWANLADANPRVRKMLESFLSVGVYGEVVVATAATAIPIAAHHGLIPEGFPVPLTFGMGAPGGGSTDNGHPSE